MHIKNDFKWLWFLAALTVYINMALCSEIQEQQDHIALLFQKNISHFGDVIIKPLSGGLSSNAKFVINTGKRCYVAKLFDSLSPRTTHEIQTHIRATRLGIAPKVHFHNADSMIMDLIPGHTLWLEQVQELKVLDELANAVCLTKRIEGAYEYKDIFGLIQSLFDQLRSQYPIYPTIAQAMKKLEELKVKIHAQSKPLVFCHGDLHPRNIFFTDQKIIFIDWSDGGMCYPFFDLADISISCCLNNKQDAYILKRFLLRDPTINERQYFYWMKSILRIQYVLLLFKHLQNQHPSYCPTGHVSVQKFYDYQISWAKDLMSDVPEFTYELACAQLQEFFTHVDKS